jgi:hypothetical protein
LYGSSGDDVDRVMDGKLELQIFQEKKETTYLPVLPAALCCLSQVQAKMNSVRVWLPHG